MLNTSIHNVTIHEAKSNLSKLLVKVELGQTIRVYRNKTPIAEIVPISTKIINPLTLHAELKGIQFNYDPTEPLTKEEWPIEAI
jgi:antitoxin (DNA-binding transcriptional repressor) of toxin-antitoxin stability system